jgi:hypothetical protein
MACRDSKNVGTSICKIDRQRNKTTDYAVLTVLRRQNGNHVNVPVRLIMIRDPEIDAIRFAFSNIMDADTKVIAKMQANRYWIERNFEDAKGLCDMDSFRGRNWNSWHHHIALVALSLLFLLMIQLNFKKMGNILSLDQILSIFKLKNPLRKLSAEELADSINYVNEIRAKMWVGRMNKCLKQRYENATLWITRLIETKSDLTI